MVTMRATHRPVPKMTPLTTFFVWLDMQPLPGRDGTSRECVSERKRLWVTVLWEGLCASPSADASDTLGPGRGPGSGLSGEGTGMLTQPLRCGRFSPHLEMNATPFPTWVIFKTNLG